MGFYRVYKLDAQNDENGNGSFVQMIVVDSDIEVIGANGTGEGFDESGILHQWNPPDGHVAVKHQQGENQPVFGARRFSEE